MPSPPRLRFLSLFVPDLEAAARRYELILGAPPLAEVSVPPSPHPFAAGGPVVFDAGGVFIALYACDGKTTHVGDVGIGLVVAESVDTIASAARQAGAKVFRAPRGDGGEPRAMALVVTPDRHFFEVIEDEEPVG